MTPTKIAFVLAPVIALALSTGASAQSWPDKPITIVVPFAAGGSTDVTARLVANHLNAAFKQPVIVENKPGAGGDLGADYVARAKPDGYTFLFGTTGPLAISQFMGSQNTFDPQKAFAPIVTISRAPNAALINAKLPASNLAELIELSKKRKDGISFASPGAMTTGHFAGEWLKKQSGANFVHIPYKGSGPAVVDLVAGQIELAFDSPVSYGPHLKSGAVKILAVTTDKRFSTLPDVPAISENGYNMNVAVWFALVGPAGIPAEAIEKINKEVNILLKTPQMRERLATFSAEPVGGTAEDLAKLIKDETESWRRIVTETGLKPK